MQRTSILSVRLSRLWLDLAEHLWLDHVTTRQQMNAESYTFISGFVRCSYTVSPFLHIILYKYYDRGVDH